MHEVTKLQLEDAKASDTVSWLTGLFITSCSYKVSPADLTDLHVIRYEQERDLMPLILSNTQYSIERGQETLHEYDLQKIQRQIVSRFLLGKPLITLNVSNGTTSSNSCSCLFVFCGVLKS